tara:strand:+ start:264 stop:560 length:297 start_codon:yes stop_codon:yes gene_type:complete
MPEGRYMERNQAPSAEAPFARHHEHANTPSDILRVEYQLARRNEQTCYPELLLRYLVLLIAENKSAQDLNMIANDIRAELNDWHIRQLREKLRQTFSL